MWVAWRRAACTDDGVPSPAALARRPTPVDAPRNLLATYRRFGLAQPNLYRRGKAKPPVGRQQVAGGVDRVVQSLERGMQRHADVAEGFLDQGNLDGLLARQMLVEGGGPDAELLSDPSHREGLRALPFEEVAGGGNDLVGPRGATGSALPRRHQAVAGGSSSNTGWRGAMAAISSGLASGPTPSKNTPTSGFQRRR